VQPYAAAPEKFSGEPGPLLADAEPREDDPQHIVGGDLAGDGGELLLGLPQVFGEELERRRVGREMRRRG
jgi:hypothetical protein